MDAKKVVKELRTLYPGRKIYFDKKEDPTEAICEIESIIDNPERSVFIAVIDKRIDHYHRNTKEVFEVIKGSLILTIDGKQHTINPGRRFIIKPGQVHFAEGHDTWVKVTSTPGMDPKDHFLIK